MSTELLVEQPSHHPHFRTDGSVDSDASLSSSKACVLGLLTRPVPHFVHLNPVHLHVLHGASAPGDVDFLPDGEIAGGAETLVGCMHSLNHSICLWVWTCALSFFHSTRTKRQSAKAFQQYCRRKLAKCFGMLVRWAVCRCLWFFWAFSFIYCSYSGAPRHCLRFNPGQSHPSPVTWGHTWLLTLPMLNQQMVAWLVQKQHMLAAKLLFVFLKDTVKNVFVIDPRFCRRP